MVASSWCSSIWVSVFTLFTADYGTFRALFHKQYFTNDWQQYSAGLKGNFGLLVVCISQESSGEKKEFLFKVLVIGDLGVGKTSIIKRYVHQFFSVHYRATISFFQKKFLTLSSQRWSSLVSYKLMRSVSCIHSVSPYFQFLPSMISSVVEILITLYRSRLSSINFFNQIYGHTWHKIRLKMPLLLSFIVQLVVLVDLDFENIGVDFALKVINWDTDTLIRLQLWDIAGKLLLHPLVWLSMCTCSTP